MPDKDKHEYDVFISYSSKDKAWVRGELLKRIEQAGLKAFIDFRDFIRGAPSIKEMERGVLTCRKTLLILTPDYIQSEWCELEGVMAQTLSPANRDLRVIPLLKTPCEKPLYVGALTHIDFTEGADQDLAWRQLLTALGAPPAPTAAEPPKRDDWCLAHPYPMPPNFTGRAAERKMLSDWLNARSAHPMLVLHALGGFGKSALAWHWLMQDVAPAAWPRVLWWGFYDDDSFDCFLERAVKYLRAGDPAQLGPRQRLDALLAALRQPGALLILDGFERALRAYGGLSAAYQGDEPGGGGQTAEIRGQRSEVSERDCISPLVEHFLRAVVTLPGIRAKVLLTTRLRPRAVEEHGALLDGCREEELTQLQPADAVEFFRAQGIRGTRAEIEAACAPYGHHPLSLRLLAGLIVGDPQQPGDIVAAKRLDVSGDLIARQHHVLETAYNSLTPARQSLLGRIACFRGPVKYEALKAIAETPDGPAGLPPHWRLKGKLWLPETSPDMLDVDLRDLTARGLLHHDRTENRFDLHPIVRRYTYDRLTAPDRAAAHTRLRDYFAAVPRPDKVTRLDDLAPVIELYHHTVRAGQYDEAFRLFKDRIYDAAYYQLGAYQLQIDLLSALFPDGEDCPPRLKNEFAQAWTLQALANCYSLRGQSRLAVPLFDISNVINEKRGVRADLATGLSNVADDQLKIGSLRAAEANLRRSIALSKEVKDDLEEAVGHEGLGQMLTHCGAYGESKAEFALSLKVFEDEGQPQWLSVVCADLAHLELLLLRLPSQSAIGNVQSAIASAGRALELADEDARTSYPVERDYIRAHWLLGAAYRVASQTDEAERHLHEALERCRRINNVEHEANILIDLARLRAATGATDEARRLAEEALGITERSGYVLQGADAHLELAKLALARGDKATAKEHAQKAKDLAFCDGPPDYTYKAAYDEALALLAELPP